MSDSVETGGPVVTGPWRPGGLVRLLLLYLLLGVLLCAYHSVCPDLVGSDDYFHMKLAELTRRQGGIVRSFPWTELSTWSRSWSDSSYLFHLLLIPFSRPGDPIGSARTAVFVFGPLVLVLFYWLLKANRCPMPWVFLLLLLSSGAYFFDRLLQVRALILSVSLVLLLVHGLIHARIGLSFVASALYPLSYTALHVPIFLAGLHLLSQAITNQRVRLKASFSVVFGVAFGCLVHPNFPNNLSMWWLQNAGVLSTQWLGLCELQFGEELYPADTRSLVISAFTVVLVLVVGAIASLLRRREVAQDTTFVFLTSLAFGILTCFSARFIEYWAPLSIAYGAFLARDLVDLDEISVVRANRPRQALLAAVAGLATLASLFARSSQEIVLQLSRVESSGAREAALWLSAHTKPKTRVFTGDFDDFGSLFYWNHSNYYLLALDPFFMFARDPELYALFRSVGSGELVDPYSAIKKEFGSSYAFVTTDQTGLTERLRKDPRVSARVSSKGFTLFELGPDLNFVTGWRVAGPWPSSRGPSEDELTRLSGSRQSAPDPAAKYTWKVYDPRRFGSIVALDRFLGGREWLSGSKPSAVMEAVALATFDSPGGGPVDVSLGFHDGLDLFANGEKVFSDPGPGGGVLDRFRVTIRARKGENRLVVRCRSRARAWGFSARLLGSHADLRWL